MGILERWANQLLAADINTDLEENEDNCEVDFGQEQLAMYSDNLEFCHNRSRKLQENVKWLRSDVDRLDLSSQPGWFTAALFDDVKYVSAISWTSTLLVYLVSYYCFVLALRYRVLGSAKTSDSVSDLFERCLSDYGSC